MSSGLAHGIWWKRSLICCFRGITRIPKPPKPNQQFIIRGAYSLDCHLNAEAGIQLVFNLVGGFNPSAKYQWKWESSSNRGENNNCLKPPPSNEGLVVCHYRKLWWVFSVDWSMGHEFCWETAVRNVSVTPAKRKLGKLREKQLKLQEVERRTLAAWKISGYVRVHKTWGIFFFNVCVDVYWKCHCQHVFAWSYCLGDASEG